MYNKILNLSKIYLKASIRSKGFNLNAFKSLQSLSDIYYYCVDNLQFIDKGSSRAVFILTPKKVIKVALNEAGLLQNEKELNVYNDIPDSKAIAKIYDHDPNNQWIISDLLRPINLLSDHRFDIILQYMRTTDPTSRSILVKEYNITDEEIDLVNDLKILEKKYELRPSDLYHSTSWGKNRDGSYQVLDYGFDDNIVERYNSPYEDVTKSNFSLQQIFNESLKIKNPIKIEKLLKSDVYKLDGDVPYFALQTALNIPGADINFLQKIVLDSERFYLIAKFLSVFGADIKKLLSTMKYLDPYEFEDFLIGNPQYKAYDL